MKIAFVRGPFLNPWELQSYVPVAKRHAFSAIGSDWQIYRQPIDLPGIAVRKAGAWGAWLGRRHSDAAILYNRALSWSLGRSFGLRRLAEAVGSADIVHAADPHLTLS